MKLFRSYSLIFTILAFSVGCKKGTTNPALAALNIIPATTDAPSLYVYATFSPENFYLQQAPISNYSTAEMSLPSGEDTLDIFSSADTTHSIFEGLLAMKAGGIYSLFLTGQLKAYDTLLTQDQIPNYSDSSAGVRIVNLSSGFSDISVNLAGNLPTQTEFSNLGQKAVSAFKQYTAVASVGGAYNFEIRQQANDSLLATYSWSFTVQRCNTIVLSGSLTTSINVFQVNNF